MDNTNQQASPVQNKDQPQTPPPNPSGHTKIFIIALGIMFVLMVGIGSYVLSTRKNQPAVQNNQVSISPTTPQPSPTPDPTANWKTYKNEEFGFEVKYPKEFQITKEFVFDSWGHVGFSCNTLKDCEKYLVFDAIQYKDSNIAFLKYNKDEMEVYAVIFIKERTLSGDGVGRIEIMTQNPLSSIPFKYFADQILSTFKFTQ